MQEQKFDCDRTVSTSLSHAASCIDMVYCLQVLEFVRFKERLIASHARAVAYAELAVHRLTSLSARTPATMLRASRAAADTLKSAPLPGARLCFLSCHSLGPKGAAFPSLLSGMYMIKIAAQGRVGCASMKT